MTERNGWEWLRVITPILVTINLFILGQIWMQVTEIGTRLYQHQTNAELHVPKSEFVSLQNQLVEMRKEIIATIRATHEPH